jgi:hypothetical protein
MIVWFAQKKVPATGNLHYKKQIFVCLLVCLMNLIKWMVHTEKRDWRNTGNEL